MTILQCSSTILWQKRVSVGEGEFLEGNCFVLLWIKPLPDIYTLYFIAFPLTSPSESPLCPHILIANYIPAILNTYHQQGKTEMLLLCCLLMISGIIITMFPLNYSPLALNVYRKS